MVEQFEARWSSSFYKDARDKSDGNVACLWREEGTCQILKLNGFSIRSATRVAQSSSEAVQDLANQFMDHVRPPFSLDCRDKQWIMNMDQTAMFFSMKPRTTIDEKGRRTVTVRDTKNGDSRITVAVSITADGRVLKPFLVMKGKKHSCIESIILFIISIIPLTSVVHT
jgi:DDE superfamily endonuclease.